MAQRPHFDNGSDVFFGPSSTPETPVSWSPRPALIRLGPGSVSRRVVEEMTLETTLFSQTTTRHRHSIYHPVGGFLFRGKQPFCFSEKRGVAKKICPLDFSLGDLG